MRQEESADVSATCPSRAEIEAFIRGMTDDRLAVQISEHIGQCETCLAFAESTPIDALEASMKNSTARLQFSDEPECDELRARACSLCVEDLSDRAENELSAPTETIGAYELIELLGHGGMGRVYRARHIFLERFVAVKLLSHRLGTNQEAIARFRREMSVIGSLDHPNLVRALDADEVDGQLLLVMELVEGADLSTTLRRCGPLSIGAACEAVRQAAIGLASIWERKLVHRDIKPSNLMVDNIGTVKILDLGLARLFDPELVRPADLTRLDVVVGTLDYVAPEAIEHRSLDCRTDIYSLGCTLFSLLVGNPPFALSTHDTPLKRLNAHVSCPAPSVMDFRPELPAAVDAIVTRMLAKDPAERFQLPSEVASALSSFADCDELRNVIRRTLAGIDEPAVSDVADIVASERSTMFVATSAAAAPASPMRPIGTQAAGRNMLFWFTLGMSVLFVLCLMQWNQISPLILWGTRTDDPVLPQSRSGWTWLLERPPEELLWNAAGGDNTWSFMPNLRQVNLNAKDEALLSIATVNSPSYIFQADMMQPRWTGGCGVFFGFHEVFIDGERCWQYQVLRLSRDPAEKIERAYSLTRLIVTAREAPDGRYVSQSHAFRGQVVKLADPGDVAVEIVVSRDRLIRIRFGGQVLPEMSDSAIAPPADARFLNGQMGFYGLGSSTWFRNPRLLLKAGALEADPE